jgi:hypothetical protein
LFLPDSYFARQIGPAINIVLIIMIYILYRPEFK